MGDKLGVAESLLTFPKTLGPYLSCRKNGLLLAYFPHRNIRKMDVGVANILIGDHR